MAGLESQMLDAASNGDLEGVLACLAAGADANGQDDLGRAPIHLAARYGHPSCVAALVAGGANANIRSNTGGRTPLHYAAQFNHPGCVQLLLAAGADLLALTAAQHWTPLHYAAYRGACQVVRLLLQAQPASALARNHEGNTPLILAIRFAARATARCLLGQGLLQPAKEVLAALASAGARAQPLYATLVSRQPLTAEEWALVPSPCPVLGAALPAVLGRSAEEAALLVQHLPAADQQRLQAAALCLRHAQQQAGIDLPSPIVWCILAQSAGRG